MNHQRGFTLLETIVALFVLAVALSGSISALLVNSFTSNQIRNGLIANNLTQEGLEIVRNLRDSGWYTSNDPSAFGVYLPAGDWIMQWDTQPDPPPQTFIPPQFTGQKLRLQPSGIYSYDAGGIETPFTRKITMRRIPAAGTPTEIIANVDVSWSDRGAGHSVNGELHLYNWY